MSYDPGMDMAARHPGWVVSYRPLPGAMLELLSWRQRVVIVDDALDPRTARCALAHALAHLDLQHRWPLDRWAEAGEEVAADRLAAQRLLPLPLLAHVLDAGQCPAASATELGVTRHLLEVRLRYMRIEERRLLRRRAAAREEVA